MKTHRHHPAGLRRRLTPLCLLMGCFGFSAGLLGQATATLSGRVMEQDTDVPVRDAVITVTGDASGTTTSGSDGRYRISGLTTGQVQVAVSKAGLRSSRDSLSLTAGNNRYDPALGMDFYELEGLVVTGTGGGAPRRKLDTSFAISTVSPARMEEFSPTGFADSLKMVPGFAVESSAGESSNNAFVRGLVSNTLGFPYLAFLEDGLPLFVEFNDWPFRFSTSLERIESVRGGTSPITQPQAIGGLVNYINREGTEVTDGQIALAFGDYNHLRTDMYVGGPINEDTTYFVGGFFRQDDGIKDVGYTGSDGGQIVGNIKYEINDGRGHVKFSGRYTDDTTIFYAPTVMQDRDDPSGIPGLGTDQALNGEDTWRFMGPSLDGDPSTVRLGNEGQPTKFHYFGGEFNYDVTDNINVDLRSRYSEGDMGIITMFNRGDEEIFTAQEAVDWVRDNAIGYGGDFATQFSEANAPDARFLLSRDNPDWVVGRTGPMTVEEASQLNGNGLFTIWNLDRIEGHLENFTVQGTVNGEFELGNGMTLDSQVGYFFADQLQRENFRRDVILTDVKSQAERYDIEFGTAGDGGSFDSAGKATLNGIARTEDFANGFEVDNEYTGIWTTQTLSFGRFVVDAGLRRSEVEGTWRQRGTWMSDNLDLSGGQAPVWSSWDSEDAPNPQLSSIPVTVRDYRTQASMDSESTHNYTVGVNYTLIEDEQSVWGRFSRGSQLPSVRGTVGDGFGNANKITAKSYELGYKLNKQNYALAATAYYNDISPVGIGDSAVIDGRLQPIGVNTDSNALGVELEAHWVPLPQLNLRLVGTFQNLEVDNVTDQNTGDPIPEVNGNVPTRQPEFYFTVYYDYTFKDVPGLTYLRLFGNTQYMGERYANIGNSFKLDPYSLTSFGISAVRGPFEVELQARNVFESDGLTEGNPRGGQQVDVAGTEYFWARPVLPRTVTLKFIYNF